MLFQLAKVKVIYCWWDLSSQQPHTPPVSSSFMSLNNAQQTDATSRSVSLKRLVIRIRKKWNGLNILAPCFQSSNFRSVLLARADVETIDCSWKNNFMISWYSNKRFQMFEIKTKIMVFNKLIFLKSFRLVKINTRYNLLNFNN